MAEAVVEDYSLGMTGVETLDAAQMPSATNASDRDLNHNKFNFNGQLDGTTTPAVTKIVTEDVTLGASPHAIDLTAAPLSVNRVESLTGLKLVGWQIKAYDTNTGPITVDPTVTNGYAMYGAGNDRVLQIGEIDSGQIVEGVVSGKPAVSGTAKAIEISGTLGDKLRYIMYFG
jgi:hypothetical protein